MRLPARGTVFDLSEDLRVLVAELTLPDLHGEADVPPGSLGGLLSRWAWEGELPIDLGHFLLL